MEELIQLKSFFKEEVPSLLADLQSDSKAAWGRMDVCDMLVHLEGGLKLSMIDEERSLLIPEDKVERYQAFLRSDKSFPANQPKPDEYKNYEPSAESFMSARKSLLKTLSEFLLFLEKNPDFSTIHPNFGRLDGTLWLNLHRKHFRHHFAQFGLIELSKD
jgi:oxepin-CoA hydrolase/3-oxo-5,6-dehydrosuberyl-CoA semialdehyde dehydrogenase